MPMKEMQMTGVQTHTGEITTKMKVPVHNEY